MCWATYLRYHRPTMTDARQPRTYLRREPDGYWRYIRRVPKDIQQAVQKSRWRYSLGRDKVSAREQAKRLERAHDDLIQSLRDPEKGQQIKLDLAKKRIAARFADLEAKGAPEGDSDQLDEYGDSFPDAEPNDTATLDSFRASLWRRVPDVLENAENLPEGNRAQRLATFAAMAFGPEGSEVEAPTGKVAAMQHSAHKAMLDDFRREIDPSVGTTPPGMRLSALIEEYITKKRLRAQTARSYRQMAGKLVETFKNEPGGGDRALEYYTKARLQRHRDRLENSGTLSAQSIEKAFTPLKAVWRWAAIEHDSLAELTFPTLILPRRETTIEESRWVAFTDDEIGLIGRLVNEAWGPKSARRFSEERKADFLMATRVMLYTGMRPNEVFKIRSEQVDNGILHIRETKTTSRKVPLPDCLADFPDFLAQGGFQTARTSTSIAGTMSDYFSEMIRPHIIDDRKVLYSLKDTLVERLQRQDGMTDDLIRAVIGHKSGQGKLRHYKTPMGETAHGRAKIKRALDAIHYW